MNSIARIVVASLLCLLLPLQAGAATAHSTMMSAQHAKQAGAQPLQLAHAIGVPHQHGAHSHHENLPNKKAGKPVKARAVQQAKADCHQAAKCCLAAASAPPSANHQCFDPAIARVAYMPHSVPAAAFFTDGPERPPRFLNA